MTEILFARTTDVPAITGVVRYDAAQSLTAGQKTQVQTNIGLVIGTNVQAFSAELAGLVALATTGIMRRTGAGTYTAGTAVSYAEMQNVSATSRILGRKTAGAGVIEELTAADVSTMLGLSSPPGTVTSVALTAPGIFTITGSPVTTAGTLGLVAAGTSGGIPYFSGATTLASSGALTANLPVIGGGAGVSPTVGTRSGNTTQFVTTTGTLTSGDCVKIDANGNFVAQGSACGAGGSGITALTGDVTASGSGSVAATVVNLPTGVTMAGSLLVTNIAAPATPAAGKTSIYVDSTTKRLSSKNDAGTIGVDVVFDTGAANNFLTAISAAGVISKAQPAFSNLSGSVAAGQMPALTGDVTTSAGTVATTLAAGNAGNLNSGTLLAARMPALTGDITTSAGAIATTLATVNGNVGTFGSATQVAQVTVNGKGLVTAVANVTVAGGVTGLANPTNPGVNITGSNGSATTAMRSDAVLVLDQTLNMAWTGQHIHTVARTITSATAAALDDWKIAAATTTITGNTGSPITLLAKAGVYRATLTDASAVTITDAASFYVDNSPLAAGSVTLTNTWAILVGAGSTKLQATTINAALTYGGVTLANSVTGTSSMVLSASPTLSGTIGGALTFSGALTLSSALTYGGVTLSNAVTGTGNMVLSAAATLTGTTTVATLAPTTINAFTLGGTVAGGGNQINNIIIGNSTPLAGSFTIVNASTRLVTSASIGYSGFDSTSGMSLTATGRVSFFANNIERLRIDASTSASGNDITTSLQTMQFNSNVIVNNARTIVSAASVAWGDYSLNANTTFLSGSTNITSHFAQTQLFAGILSAASALTITNASTFYIDGPPTGGGAGPATITNAWSLYVASGKSAYNGALLINDTPTVVAASSITWQSLQVQGTLTLTGTTAVTADIAKTFFATPTVTDASAVTVSNASTVYIGGPPTAGGSVTITDAFALKLASGNMSFATSTYINFGNTSGTGGYGFRDNAGTMQVKNSAGAWANFSSGAAALTVGTTTIASGTDGKVLYQAASGLLGERNIYFTTNDQMLFNNATSISFAGTGSNTLLQVQSTTAVNAAIASWAATGGAFGGGSLLFYKSNSGTVGTATVVASGDYLGNITFVGAQQTGTVGTQNVAAVIRAVVDGTVTSGASADMPGRLEFLTTPDGSGTPVINLTIDNAGQLFIGTAPATDATKTDNTMCRDTTTGQVYRGSGTLGICLGTSGRQFKQENTFKPLADGLTEILALKPLNFFYKDGFGDDGAREQYGLIADEVFSVLPKLARLDEKGVPISVDLLGMVPVLIKAAQELKFENDTLRKRLDKLDGAHAVDTPIV